MVFFFYLKKEILPVPAVTPAHVPSLFLLLLLLFDHPEIIHIVQYYFLAKSTIGIGRMCTRIVVS